MFSWQHHITFSFFILDKSGNKISVSDWQQIQDDYLPQLSILNELCDNGFAEHTTHTCEVEASEILNLDEIDKQLLCLPNRYPYEIYIQSDGQLNQPNFKFKFGFYDFTPNGNRLAAKRNGATVEIEERNYLLSANQFLICEFHLQTASKNFPENSRSFIVFELMINAESFSSGKIIMH